MGAYGLVGKCAPCWYKTLDPPGSASRMSVDSEVSGEEGGSDKMTHLSAFFKCDKAHATCTKCDVRLKLQEKSLFNLKKQYKAKHAILEGDFLAAASGVGRTLARERLTSRGGRPALTHLSGTSLTRGKPWTCTTNSSSQTCCPPS